ncbi:unnamed protein product [[Candida] boidinii]|nr:unnamed protein product [[Candida] boidinii]
MIVDTIVVKCMKMQLEMQQLKMGIKQQQQQQQQMCLDCSGSIKIQFPLDSPPQELVLVQYLDPHPQ